MPTGGMERVASFAPALDRTPASMVTALPLVLGGELSGSHPVQTAGQLHTAAITVHAA